MLLEHFYDVRFLLSPPPHTLGTDIMRFSVNGKAHKWTWTMNSWRLYQNWKSKWQSWTGIRFERTFDNLRLKFLHKTALIRSQIRTKRRDFQRNEPAYRKPREARALLIRALLHFTWLIEEIEGGRAKLTRWSVSMWYIDDNFDKCRGLELWSKCIANNL